MQYINLKIHYREFYELWLYIRANWRFVGQHPYYRTYSSELVPCERNYTVAYTCEEYDVIELEKNAIDLKIFSDGSHKATVLIRCTI